MSASWIVSVGGRGYGPYTDAQMAAFAAEGRLAPQSLIARSGEDGFRPAATDPALAPLFAPSPGAATPAPAGPADGEAMHDEPGLHPEPKPGGVFGKSKDDGHKPGERSHMLIVADMKSRSINGLEEEIYKLGHACSLVPQTWLLRTEQSINTVRNLLVQQLGTLDVLFVVDASHDKAAWFNFGPESESRIRRLWSRSAEEQSKVRATG